jgi:glutamate synthase (NADPH/NADH) large chain
VLRARFQGTPENVINFLFYVAEELRGIMARLGFRTVASMVGRTDCVVARNVDHPKASRLDFTDLLMLATPGGDAQAAPASTELKPGELPRWDAPLSPADEALLEGARVSLKYNGEPSTVQVQLTNADRAFGARLAGEIARKYGADGLREEARVVVEATGTAGQSFGAFATRGMLIVLEGDANDYVGKGLSGGVLAVHPPARARFKAHEQVIVGNTVLYGATSGKAFFAGRAGERFAVRNSGAVSVVEGVGDHGCEYMTGGTVVVLGPTGRNFAAGMSGGIAYVMDDERTLGGRVSKAMVDLESMSAEDEELVKALIEEHCELTRSARGKQVLASWSKHHFVKVMPHEWRRVLQARSTQTAQANAKAAASHG